MQELDVLLGQRVPRGQAGDEISRVALAANQRDDQGSLHAGELGEELQTASGIGGQAPGDFDAGRRCARKSFRQLERTEPGQLSGGLADPANHGADF